MKLLVVPIETPLPANSGGRIDVTRRLRALRDAGHETALLTWHNVACDGEPPATLHDQLGRLCQTYHLARIERAMGESVRRLAHLWRLPSYAAARWATLDKPTVLRWARAFAPDVVVLDGLYGVAAARWLARELGVPWVYRAHNIEHHYMRDQRDCATSWTARMRLNANLLGLRRAEEAAVRDAACTFDISLADAEHWRRQGHRAVHWLPTVVDADFADAMQAASTQAPLWDLVYFGNLNTPNNVQAVQWLLTQVLPRLQAPGLRIAVAGSRPSDAVQRAVAADARVTLIADPPSIPAIAGAARVLVNPVQAGSGVNLKSVEMLFGAARLVSTSVGVQGLPAAAAACFSVHDAAAAFAQAIDAARAQPLPAAERDARVAARLPFVPEGAVRVLTETLQPMLAREAA